MNKAYDPVLSAVAAIIKDERKLTHEQIASVIAEEKTELIDMIAEVQKQPGPKGDQGEAPSAEDIAKAVTEAEGFWDRIKGEPGESVDPEEVIKALRNDELFRKALAGKDADPRDVVKLFLADEDLMARLKGKDVDPDEIVKRITSDDVLMARLKGKPGENGQPGKDADPAEVVKLFLADEDLMERLKGQPGKDANPEDVVVLFKSDPDLLDKMKPEKGDRGQTGRPGKDGADADPIDVAALLVQEYLDDIKGPKGDAPSVDEIVKAILDKHIDVVRGPSGKDADEEGILERLKADKDFRKAVTGPTGQKGDPGQKGDTGEPGRDRPVFDIYDIEPGDKLAKNDIGRFSGSLWQAVRKTKGSPKEDPSGWRNILDGIEDITQAFDAEARQHVVTVHRSSGETHDVKVKGLPTVFTEEPKTPIEGDILIQGKALSVFIDEEWREYNIQGQTGDKGDPGKRGPKGLAGVGIKDIEFLTKDGHVVVWLTMTDGTEKDFILDIAVPEQEEIDQEIRRFAGGWRYNESYLAGDVVSSPGGLHLALQDTRAELVDTTAWARMLGVDGGMTSGGGGTTSSTGVQFLSTPASLSTTLPTPGALVYVGSTNQLYVGQAGLAGWSPVGQNLMVMPNVAAVQAITGAASGQLAWASAEDKLFVLEGGTWVAAGGGAGVLTAANQGARLNYTPIADIQAGSLVYQVDTSILWQYTGSVPANAGTIGAAGNWTQITTAGATPKVIEVANPAALAALAAQAAVDTSNPLYLVHFDTAGQPLDRLYYYDTGAANFLPVSTKSFIKATRAAADPAGSVATGDLQATTEVNHVELKTYDGTAWQMLFSEDTIKAWIAAGSLFRGTVMFAPVSGGALDLATLPSPAAANNGNYWTWVGPANTNVTGTTPTIGGDLSGEVLQVGDWIQIVSDGGGGYKWAHVPADLLSKLRGDNLYSIQPWVAGTWEQNSVVSYQGRLWRAARGTAPTDPAPQVAGVPIAIRGTAMDAYPATTAAILAWVNATPPTPANSGHYVVVNAGGAGAVTLPGGGTINVSVGDAVINLGIPTAGVEGYAVVPGPFNVASSPAQTVTALARNTVTSPTNAIPVASATQFVGQTSGTPKLGQRLIVTQGFTIPAGSPFPGTNVARGDTFWWTGDRNANDPANNIVNGWGYVAAATGAGLFPPVMQGPIVPQPIQAASASVSPLQTALISGAATNTYNVGDVITISAAGPLGIAAGNVPATQPVAVGDYIKITGRLAGAGSAYTFDWFAGPYSTSGTSQQVISRPRYTRQYSTAPFDPVNATDNLAKIFVSTTLALGDTYGYVGSGSTLAVANTWANAGNYAGQNLPNEVGKLYLITLANITPKIWAVEEVPSLPASGTHPSLPNISVSLPNLAPVAALSAAGTSGVSWAELLTATNLQNITLGDGSTLSLSPGSILTAQAPLQVSAMTGANAANLATVAAGGVKVGDQLMLVSLTPLIWDHLASPAQFSNGMLNEGTTTADPTTLTYAKPVTYIAPVPAPIGTIAATAVGATPWVQIPIQGDFHSVLNDTALPAGGAPQNEVYFVSNSALAGNNPAFYTWSGTAWSQLGGGGTTPGGGTIQSGNAFPPVSQADNLFWRTDLSILFLYDGTNWIQMSQTITGPLGGVGAGQVFDPAPVDGDMVENPVSGAKFKFDGAIGAYVSSNTDKNSSQLIGSTPVVAVSSGVTFDPGANTPPADDFLEGTLAFDDQTDLWWQVRKTGATKSWVGATSKPPVISFATEVALLATSPPDGTLSYAYDTGYLGLYEAGVWEPLHNSITPAGSMFMIGDVKQSWLTETEFRGQLSATERNKWVLADGRNVAGSKFSAITGQDNVPDMRGTYMRVPGRNGNIPEWMGFNHRQQYDMETALPTKAFTGTTSTDGRHRHEQGYYTTDAARMYAHGHRFTGTNGPVSSNELSTLPRDLPYTAYDGNHKHTVTINGGGDTETRPKTTAINTFIKVN